MDDFSRLAAIAARYGVPLGSKREIRIPCPMHIGEDPNLKINVSRTGKLNATCESHQCHEGNGWQTIINKLEEGLGQTWKNSKPTKNPPQS